MDEIILCQLVELACAFNKISIKPVICGGLGIYLYFYNRQSELPLRTTNDIDLILTKTHVPEQLRCEAIAELITGELGYKVCEGGKHFQFEKANQQKLDILAQPIEGIDVEGFRVKFVKSHLHGYLTPEACFIEEDLRTIFLPDILPDNEKAKGLEVFVPSPTNFLLLKLFAFDDRDEKKENDTAQTHAFDVYVTITLADRNDYLQGQKFLARHKSSKIIQRAESIVTNKFSSVEQPGWLYVLKTSNFYPNLNVQQKRERLDEAKRRLVRWFTVSP
jgi:hypothetical protein